MDSREESVSLARIWAGAAVVVALAITSCTGSNYYQERVFKTKAVEAGMTASEVACAWSEAGNNGSTAACVLNASKGQ